MPQGTGWQRQLSTPNYARLRLFWKQAGLPSACPSCGPLERACQGARPHCAPPLSRISDVCLEQCDAEGLFSTAFSFIPCFFRKQLVHQALLCVHRGSKSPRSRLSPQTGEVVSSAHFPDEESWGTGRMGLSGRAGLRAMPVSRGDPGRLPGGTVSLRTLVLPWRKSFWEFVPQDNETPQRVAWGCL